MVSFASLARPGGNITGVTILVVELIVKCLERMHNLMPPGTTIAVLINPANVTQAAIERQLLRDAERVLGARVVILNASSPGEIEPAFATLLGERVGALVVSGETFFLTQRHRLVERAAQHAVPTIYAYREAAVAGGLMSYGGSLTTLFRMVGVYTGRILRGRSRPIYRSSRPRRWN